MPSSNGEIGGRDSRGRFSVGNPGGPGNPFGQRVAELRRAFLDAVTPADIDAIVRVLVDAAKGGDVKAAREVLNRIVGTPAASISVESEPPDKEEDRERRRLALLERLRQLGLMPEQE